MIRPATPHTVPGRCCPDVLLDRHRSRRAPALAHGLLGARDAVERRDNGGMPAIRANSVLPARREAITLHTADGLELVGELALPEDRDPVATLVCLHPLPTHGGMMDSHVFRKAAFRLPALAGLAVLRFNTRGTSSVQGTSEGAFDNAVRRAVRRRRRHRVRRVPRPAGHLAGRLVVRHRPGADARPATRPCRARSCSRRRCGSATRAPRRWAESGKPVTALVPEHDDYLQPPEARERFAAVPQAEVVGVDGRQAPVGRRRRDGARRDRARGSPPTVDVPLPTEWDGPMETADTSAYADRTTAAFKDVPR